jgi:hypothetical protein
MLLSKEKYAEEEMVYGLTAFSNSVKSARILFVKVLNLSGLCFLNWLSRLRVLINLFQPFLFRLEQLPTSKLGSLRLTLSALTKARSLQKREERLREALN